MATSTVPTSTIPLMQQWRLLQEDVVPPLLEAEARSGGARAWAVGEVADAVAVAAAYRHVTGDPPGPLEAFSTGPCGRRARPVPDGFTLADIRAVPRSTRDSVFQRSERGWRPDPALAERVFLGRPPGMVDVLTAPTDADGRPAVTPAMLAHLAPGGRLVLVGPSGASGRIDGMTALDAAGRVFERDRSRRAHPAQFPTPPGPPAGDADDPAAVADNLARRLAQTDLVTSHANLARSLARRFAGHGESRQDLDQVALLALVKAATRFEADRNVSFSTFATSTILGELKRHFRDRTWMMRVPRPLQETYLAVKDARDALTQELAASPTIAQIAERLRITEERVLEAMEAGENYWPESLDAGFADDQSGRDVPVTDPGFERALEHYELGHLLPRLAPRERLVLERLYIDGRTQRQVAQELGISQMQVSRLVNATLANLRHWAQ